MEVEAKFRATDRARFDRLTKARSIGEYTLIALDDEHLVDHYLDTDDHRLWERGYACRLRERESGVLVTVKGRGSADGAVHRREEIETEIGALAPPDEWPDGPARDLVLSLVPPDAVREIATIRQHRVRRAVWKEGQCIGELALDRVEMGAGENRAASLEVEIELADAGRTDDLDALEVGLRDYSLVHEPRSKFERALLLANAGEEPPFRLTPEERSGLEQLALGPDPVLAKRAQMILMASEGARSVTIGNKIGLSDSYVRRWLRHFRSRGFEIFPAGSGPLAPADEDGPSTDRAIEYEAGLEPDGDALVGDGIVLGLPGGEGIVLGLPGGEAVVVTIEDPLLAPPDDGSSIEALCARCGVDMGHARHVAELALALFEQYPDVHRVSPTRRGLLEAAALLHNVGMAVDPKKPDTAGRDLILSEPLPGLLPEERAMLACIVRFHRKRVHPDEEPVFAALSSDFQAETLALSALLRVGAALDCSGTQTSRIAEAGWSDGVARIEVDGPHASEEAARAMKKADLWNAVFSFPIEIRSADEVRQAPDEIPEVILVEILEAPEAFPAAKSPSKSTARARKSGRESGAGEPDAGREPSDRDGPEKPPEQTAEKAAAPPAAEKKGPGIGPDDAIAAAGRKVLALHFDRLILNEPGTLEGEDIEALHDMRVASRRLRAAMRIFGPYLPRKRTRPLEDGLRRIGGALGPVRDMDVLIEHAERFRDGLPDERRDDLEPLLRAWRKRRNASRNEMVGFLESREYVRFKEDWIRFLNDPIGGRDDAASSLRDPSRRPVRTVVPALLWEDYGVVLAYGSSLAGAPIDTLHALRIDCKRLRYALEFFREPLGKPGDKLIGVVTAAQDRLGEMHDADVAAGLIRDFLAEWVRKAARKHRPMSGLDGFTRYLESRETEIVVKIEAFLGVWHRLEGGEFRTLLGEAIAGL